MKNPADIKGILFDKDGTLVDFNATWLGIADFMAMDAASSGASTEGLVRHIHALRAG